MPVSFTTCPFEVTAGRNDSMMIEDRKSGQSWRLSIRPSLTAGQVRHVTPAEPRSDTSSAKP